VEREVSDERCYACLGAPRDDDPSIVDEYLPDAWCHLRCLNSTVAKAWREERRRHDPGYARYWRMSSVGRAIQCDSCGSECVVSAKARGMDAGGWEACCTACHRISGLNGYTHRAEYDRLRAAEHRFLLGPLDDSWREAVRAVADAADRWLAEQRCPCGGDFSVAAPPRCPTCGHVLFDSYFHFAFPPPTT
jgi:hypothetical protein